MKCGTIKEIVIDPAVLAVMGSDTGPPASERLDEHGYGWGTYAEWAELMGITHNSARKRIRAAMAAETMERADGLALDSVGHRNQCAWFRVKAGPAKRGRGRKA